MQQCVSSLRWCQLFYLWSFTLIHSFFFLESLASHHSLLELLTDPETLGTGVFVTCRILKCLRMNVFYLLMCFNVKWNKKYKVPPPLSHTHSTCFRCGGRCWMSRWVSPEILLHDAHDNRTVLLWRLTGENTVLMLPSVPRPSRIFQTSYFSTTCDRPGPGRWTPPGKVGPHEADQPARHGAADERDLLKLWLSGIRIDFCLNSD